MARLRFPGKDDDKEARARMGRFSDADRREMEELVRFRLNRRSAGRQPPWRKKIVDRGYRSRASFVLNNNSVGKTTEAIVKVVGTTKSAAGVFRMVCYVGRLGQSNTASHEQITLRDEFQNKISTGEVQSHIQQWDLLSDEQNLSKQARLNGAAEDLGEAERLRNVQGWHFVFSVAEDSEDDATASRLERVMAVTVDEVFSEPGFRVLWTMHRDHADHLHAHVIVKAVSRFGDRMRCDRAGDFVFGVRTIFAQNLKRAGLEYTATRQEDRWQVREAVIAGHEVLRANQHYKPYALDNEEDEKRSLFWRKTFVRSGHSDTLVRREPSIKWIGGWKADRKKRGLEKELKKTPIEYNSLIRQLSGLYENPIAACSSWMYLACIDAHVDAQGKSVHPNRARALWEIKHRLQLFGQLSQPASPELINGIVGAATRVKLPAYDLLAQHWTNTGAGNAGNMETERQGEGYSTKQARQALTGVCRVASWLEEQPGGDGKSERLRKILLSDIYAARHSRQCPQRGADATPQIQSPSKASMESNQGQILEKDILFEKSPNVRQKGTEKEKHSITKNKPGHHRKRSGIDL